MRLLPMATQLDLLQTTTAVLPSRGMRKSGITLPFSPASFWSRSPSLPTTSFRRDFWQSRPQGTAPVAAAPAPAPAFPPPWRRRRPGHAATAVNEAATPVVL